MARMSPDEAGTKILAKIQAAGGTIAHNALVDALDASGDGGAVEHVLRLTQAGVIVGQVVALADGKNELRYRSGGGN